MRSRSASGPLSFLLPVLGFLALGLVLEELLGFTPTLAVLIVAVFIASRALGPVRLVKLATFSLLLLLAVVGIRSGIAREVFPLILGSLLAGVLASSAALLLHRLPRERRFEPLADGDFPDYARATLPRISRELETLGFEQACDRVTRFRTAGSERRIFWRLFRHPALPLFASFGALEKPRVLCRAITSRLADGGALSTLDRQSDWELFDSPRFHSRQVPESASTAEMLARHQEQLAALAIAATPAFDPQAESMAVHAAWVDSVVASGQARVTGEWIAPRLSAVPRAIVRLYGAWLR